MTSYGLDELTKGERHHRAHGWTISTLVHVLCVGAALALVAEIELSVEPESFRWDVVLVETEVSQRVQESAEVQPPSPAPTSPRPIARTVETKPVMRTVQTVQQVSFHEHLPVTRQTVQPIERLVEPVAEKRQPTAQPTEVWTTTETHAVITQETVTQRDVVVDRPAPHTVQHEVQSAPTRMVHEMVERADSMEKGPVLEQERVAQSSIVQRNLTVDEPVQHVAAPTVVEQLPVQHRSLRSLPQAQADYGWLRDALWNRIEQLKRYPAQARANHWEGKVVLEAVVREDGTILDLRVAESSGHAVLDQEAMAVVKKSSPLTLKYPLGQPRITILVPISFKLDR